MDTTHPALNDAANRDSEGYLPFLNLNAEGTAIFVNEEESRDSSGGGRGSGRGRNDLCSRLPRYLVDEHKNGYDGDAVLLEDGHFRQRI